MNFFELIHEDKTTGARAGIMHTEHGDIATPCFMPVGTQATVKTLDQADLANLGAQIILGNTYHLHLRPGEDLISELGGLHKFMNWDKPILTDSGGFQVFSLGAMSSRGAKRRGDPMNEEIASSASATPPRNDNNGQLVKIDEEGVTFRSHIDGSTHRFTPESAIQIQQKLGADIIMAFDECTPDSATMQYTKEAMERTHRWAERCLREHENIKTLKHESTCRQFLFGIIQGGNHEVLRKESGKFISALDFDGIAIGGESIGYNMEATGEIMNWLAPILPKDKPRYTMGVGLAPSDLLKVVAMGADMFDCVAPTRLARHGMLFTSADASLSPPYRGGVGSEGAGGGVPRRDGALFTDGNASLSPSARGGDERGGGSRVNINNAQFAKDTGPVDETCACATCKNYTRAYLHHLFAAGEMTGQRLATIHNIHFMLNLMREARHAILEDRYGEFLKTK